MSDVVRRLHGSWGEPERTMMQEAAAEIERLQASLPPAERYWEARWRDERAEVERLKALNASFSAQIVSEQREIDRLRAALVFARSVIKSGEDWSATCERVIGGALEGMSHEP